MTKLETQEFFDQELKLLIEEGESYESFEEAILPSDFPFRVTRKRIGEQNTPTIQVEAKPEVVREEPTEVSKEKSPEVNISFKKLREGLFSEGSEAEKEKVQTQGKEVIDEDEDEDEDGVLHSLKFREFSELKDRHRELFKKYELFEMIGRYSLTKNFEEHLNQKEAHSKNLDALFVGDNLKENDEVQDDLLLKIMNSTQIEAIERSYTDLDIDKEILLELILLEIALLKPRFVVGLGSLVTNLLLKSEFRLASIHGKFYKISIEGVHKLELMPLFHPEYLKINQGIKRVAWEDLKGLIEKVGL
ncbi:MAG: hypothetical protein ACPGJV_14475 [Bacteriovoracaceae bacterium]